MKRNARRIAREIQNTARAVGNMGPHRLLRDVGRAERNLTDLHQGTRHRIEALYQLAGAVWSGKVSLADVGEWLES
jgi:hypothetical protein